MKRASIVVVMVSLGIGIFTQGSLMGNESQTTSPSNALEPTIGVLQHEVDELLPIQQKIQGCASFDEKLALVSSLPNVKKFFNDRPAL